MRQCATVAVDCNGCTACCRGMKVPLSSWENPADYRHEHDPDGRVTLETTSDGQCVYLGPDGCSIYERRPFACRTFSCVDLYREQLQAFAAHADSDGDATIRNHMYAAGIWEGAPWSPDVWDSGFARHIHLVQSADTRCSQSQAAEAASSPNSDG